MLQEQEFQFKKARVERFIEESFDKEFGGRARISLRRRQKFISQMMKLVGERFGNDVLCLLSFNKQGLVTMVLPAETESTDKGKLFRSFIHDKVFYTSHCLSRLCERMEEGENCVLMLDSFMSEALVSQGEHKGYLICSEGIFAIDEEKDRLIIKTFISYDLLDQSQIKKFYSLNGISHLPNHMISKDSAESDIILSDEYPPHATSLDR